MMLEGTQIGKKTSDHHIEMVQTKKRIGKIQQSMFEYIDRMTEKRLKGKVSKAIMHEDQSKGMLKHA